MTRTDRPCRRLAGQCIETGEHWDHYSRMVTVAAPRGFDQRTLLDVRLEQYEDGAPLLVIGCGPEAVAMSMDEVVELAAAVKAFIPAVLRLASYHAVAMVRARRHG